MLSLGCPSSGLDRMCNQGRFFHDCGGRLKAAQCQELADKIVDYHKLTAKSMGGVAGRQWVCEAVDVFLKVSGFRYFLLL
jgi:hypothetical protein